VIFVLIYLAVLPVLIWKATAFSIKSDRSIEYHEFQQMGATGKLLTKSSLCSSSVMAILLPHLISKVVGHRELVFRITPCFFQALLPAFTYLTASLYFSQIEAIALGLFASAHYYIAFYSNYGRVSCAWGMLAGLTWSLLAGQIGWSVLFVVILVLSHYGTTFFALYVFGLTWVAQVFWQENFTHLSILLVVLMALSWFWFFIIHSSTGYFVWMTIYAAFKSFYVAIKFKEPAPDYSESSASGSTMVVSIPRLPDYSVWRDKFARIRHILAPNIREPVLVALYGQSFKDMKYPQKVELILTWLIVASFIVGILGFLARIEALPPIYHQLATVASSTIVLGLVLPHASKAYGFVRIYFTALLFINGFFLLGVRTIAEWLSMNYMLLLWGLITMYALSVSGLTHKLYNFDKYSNLRGK